jgi:hypothetical protein
VLRPAPRPEARPFDVALLLPTQVPRRAPTPRTFGPHALLVRLLLDALADAGCLGRSPRWRRRAGIAPRTLARAWLAGELEDQVPLPVATVCDALGLDADALAAAVRRSQGEAGPGSPILIDRKGLASAGGTTTR